MTPVSAVGPHTEFNTALTQESSHASPTAEQGFEEMDASYSTSTIMQLSQCKQGGEEKNEEEFVLQTKPVVVDQILSGTELNLELFMGGQQQNLDDPVISQIERTLQSQNKVKKPKVADNYFEARKLQKVRKQIERGEQKQLEKARVLAKQFIRDNRCAGADDTQGVEIEFVCHGSEETGFKMNGPTISSPVKFMEMNRISPERIITSGTDLSKMSLVKSELKHEVKEEKVKVEPKTEPTDESASQSESEPILKIETSIKEEAETTLEDPDATMTDGIVNDFDFNGFTKTDSILTETHFKISVLEKKIQTRKHPALFLENNQLNSRSKVLKANANNNKRRHTENHISSIPPKMSRSTTLNAWTADDRNANKANLLSYGIENPDLFLAKVIISKSDSTAHMNLKGSNASELNAGNLMGTRRPLTFTNPDNSNKNISLIYPHYNFVGVPRASKCSKTRYSNDELFKPRPVIGGVRSRRRGGNCDE